MENDRPALVSEIIALSRRINSVDYRLENDTKEYLDGLRERVNELEKRVRSMEQILGGVTGAVVVLFVVMAKKFGWGVLW